MSKFMKVKTVDKMTNPRTEEVVALISSDHKDLLKTVKHYYESIYLDLEIKEVDVEVTE